MSCGAQDTARATTASIAPFAHPHSRADGRCHRRAAEQRRELAPWHVQLPLRRRHTFQPTTGPMADPSIRSAAAAPPALRERKSRREFGPGVDWRGRRYSNPAPDGRHLHEDQASSQA